MINPPLFIVSGILASAGELLLAPLRASYEKHSFVKRDDVDEAHYPVFRAGSSSTTITASARQALCCATAAA